MPRHEAICQILKVFRQYGYEGATLTRLAEATGLGKASLYHYFPGGKAEMAMAVLAHIQGWMQTNILVDLQRTDHPRDCLQAMTHKVNELYSQGEEACLLEVLSLGTSNPLFAAQIQAALNTWIVAIAQVLIEAGFAPDLARIRAEDAILQIQGALVLSRGLGNTAPFQRILEQLPAKLLQP